jgi:hypothetical protein
MLETEYANHITTPSTPITFLFVLFLFHPNVRTKGYSRPKSEPTTDCVDIGLDTHPLILFEAKFENASANNYRLYQI